MTEKEIPFTNCQSRIKIADGIHSNPNKEREKSMKACGEDIDQKITNQNDKRTSTNKRNQQMTNQ